MRHNTPRAKKDQLDVEALEQFERSRGWRLMSARITLMRSRLMTDLLQDQDDKGTASLRGAIKALSDVLSIPAILASEARKDVATTRTMED